MWWRISVIMDHLIVVLTLASWIGCFWLGLQIGKGQCEQRYKREVEELEHRFKIVSSEVAEVPVHSGIPTTA